MNQSFINGIKFDTKLKLKPVVETEEKPVNTKNKLIQIKIVRLIFFIVIICTLIFTVKYCAESFYCFCMHTDHKSLNQIIKDWGN